ncbi:progestin and adipoQ receptor family member 4-like isoform X2 [Protobothrops mucrosquamatus]|uniref:progestin and adipoQ receptor family member 4-like isoform X2 n=1 Tax=Protobothrops mucrosquamatus TaxID=103944 RepID=UPI000775D3DF|nr:progestin and adipoQ receptor family member 4-like isoform X2 [Protobothrops mucrosquamatus]
MAFLGGARLLDWASSPPHLQFNRFVLTGYRPVSSGSGCLRSLFYLHNELGNIYTHGNVLYHLFMNHEGGPAVYHTLLTLDMCGVCMVNTLGALPIIYCTLACSPLLRSIALLAYTGLSSYGIFCAVTARSSVRRLQAFAWQALFRFFFFYLRWVGLGTGHPTSLRSYLIMDGLAFLGGVINISRVPERWKPGCFDYWFNSHQIMHVLVVVSILYLHWGVVADLHWIANYACPKE